MEQQICDLHAHSNFSDGTFSPAELIAEAVRVGLSAVALTDHNTVGGLPAFLAAAKGTNMEAIAGVEISTDYGETELHIVGLFLDPKHFDAITTLLVKLNDNKAESNRKLVDNLVAAGYEIDYAALRAQTSSGIFNRAHVASALVEKGYVESVSEAFATLLAKDGKYYVPTKRLPVFEVISFLRSIGAVPVLAHPFLDLDEAALRIFLPRAKAAGLVAMETRYATYNQATTELAETIAREFGLSESGGSDFHGGRKPDIALGSGRGNLAVPLTIAETLKRIVL